MGYSVYYNGEIGISPELSNEHEALLTKRSEKTLLQVWESSPKTGKACTSGVIGDYPIVT